MADVREAMKTVESKIDALIDQLANLSQNGFTIVGFEEKLVDVRNNVLRINADLAVDEMSRKTTSRLASTMQKMNGVFSSMHEDQQGRLATALATIWEVLEPHHFSEILKKPIERADQLIPGGYYILRSRQSSEKDTPEELIIERLNGGKDLPYFRDRVWANSDRHGAFMRWKIYGPIPMFREEALKSILEQIDTNTRV